MKRTVLTKEQCDSYLTTVAEIKPWEAGDGEFIDCWMSKTDGSYITFTNLTEDIAWIAQLGLIQLQSTHPENPSVAQIGFDEKENKWYGWSHRAYYGFGIGFEMKKGVAGYKGRNEEEVVEACVRFWTDDYVKDVVGLFTENERGEKGVQLTGIYTETVPNKPFRGQLWEQFHHLGQEGFGKGEWTAKTIEDAKQMAIDFAKSVS